MCTSLEDIILFDCILIVIQMALNFWKGLAKFEKLSETDMCDLGLHGEGSTTPNNLSSTKNHKTIINTNVCTLSNGFDVASRQFVTWIVSYHIETFCLCIKQRRREERSRPGRSLFIICSCYSIKLSL